MPEMPNILPDVIIQVEIDGVPKDTKDRDGILESEFFDTRQAFLSLCQGNYYQYDTLRAAKHSSMMLLCHLHNPTEPAFATTCNVCKNDIKTGEEWRCKECDYDECAACYKHNGGTNHFHKLTKHPAGADRDAHQKKSADMVLYFLHCGNSSGFCCVTILALVVTVEKLSCSIPSFTFIRSI